MFQNIKEIWLTISLKRKIGSFAVMVILVMGLSVAFNIRIMDFSLGSFNVILDDNSRCHDFQEAMELEIKAFEVYVRDRTQENRDEYVLACVRSVRCLRSLPFDYERIGEERYARTWNVKNGYEGYCTARDQLLEMDSGSEDFIPRLYEIYDMQSYIQTYARRLVQVTLKEGNATYQEKVPVFYQLPYLILLFSAVMMVVALCMTKLLSSALIDPLVKLAHTSRKIARNDFSGKDITVENKDEMGELVSAFNKMKHATEGYINTLKENNEMAELLHKEELEKMEMEKRLDATRLEVLKSQINPHFLFNTLNMIACTAKLEDAKTTERMIASMSNLFRYNLKTSEQIVPLEQELKVVEDYIYLQKMRFGSRIRYTSDCSQDTMEVMIPVFALQPLVENAIVHGLAVTPEGGRLHIRSWIRGKRIFISVSDTGAGIAPERLAEIREELRNGESQKLGIGVSNISRRIKTMYPDGELLIDSREGRGTVVRMAFTVAEM